MEHIIGGIYLGSDRDVEEAKRRGYARLTCAKEGPDGHRAMIGYKTDDAPKGSDHYFAKRGDWATMNCLDGTDPNLVNDEMIIEGLKFAFEKLSEGKKILIHCNAGISRSPSVTLLLLRAVGEMPYSAWTGLKVMKTLYPWFGPNTGMLRKIFQLWDKVDCMFKENNHGNETQVGNGRTV